MRRTARIIETEAVEAEQLSMELPLPPPVEESRWVQTEIVWFPPIPVECADIQRVLGISIKDIRWLYTSEGPALHMSFRDGDRAHFINVFGLVSLHQWEITRRVRRAVLDAIDATRGVVTGLTVQVPRHPERPQTHQERQVAGQLAIQEMGRMVEDAMERAMRGWIGRPVQDSIAPLRAEITRTLTHLGLIQDGEEIEIRADGGNLHVELVAAPAPMRFFETNLEITPEEVSGNGYARQAVSNEGSDEGINFPPPSGDWGEVRGVLGVLEMGDESDDFDDEGRRIADRMLFGSGIVDED